MDVDDSFRPYQQWLGLDGRLSAPNHYQLFSLPEFESDSQRIAMAADRAIARVRSHRPGTRAAQWAELLDQLKSVRACLLDAEQKAQYDAALRAEHVPNTVPRGPVVSSPRPYGVPQPGPDPMAPVALAPTLEAVSAHAWPQPARAAAPAVTDPMAPFEPSSVTAPDDPSVAAAVPSQAAKVTRPAEASQIVAYDPFPSRRRRNEPTLIVVGLSLLCVLLLVAGAYMYITGGDWSAGDNSVAESSQQPFVPGPGIPSPARANTQLPASVNSPRPVPETPPRSAAFENGPPRSPPVAAESPVETAGESLHESAAEMPADADAAQEERPPEPSPAAPASVSGSSVPSAAEQVPPAAAMPSQEQLQQLGQLLTDARLALSQQRFADAETKLDEAQSLASLPAHAAMVRRLRKLAGYVKEFRAAIDRAVASLQAGSTFELADGEPVVLVERGPQKIIIRWRGENLSFELDRLPVKIGVPLASLALDESPSSQVIKGAFQLLHPRVTDEQLSQVRTWWQDAATAGEDVADLLPLLDDDYDLK